MSEPAAAEHVPKWDRADRMRKALRESGISVIEMAEYLGVARNTVSTWINGRIDPSPQTMRLWALHTGVPYPWLCHGTTAACETGPKVGETRSNAGRRRSNFMHSNLLHALAS